jgi:protein-S-isoprenylcysteine O-methyltransferase Ste14
LFRYRSYLPLLTLALFFIVLPTYSYPFGSHKVDLLLELTCFVIALSGLAIRIHAVGHAPRGTSGRTTRTPKASTLNTSGMYSVVRHPLYLGNLLIWGAITLFLHSVLFSMACVTLFVVYYERIILSEEAFLRQKFGREYQQWAGTTPMLLPNVAKWVRPSRSFSWKIALKREYTGLFVITTTMTALEILGDVFYKGSWTLEWPWAVVFTTGAIIYVTLRTLKKRGYLDVEGR